MTGEGTGLALIFANLHDVLKCTRRVRCKRVRNAAINLSFIMSSHRTITDAVVLYDDICAFVVCRWGCSFSSVFVISFIYCSKRSATDIVAVDMRWC